MKMVRLCLVVSLLASAAVCAAGLEVTVRDARGAPVADAVVYALGEGVSAGRAPNRDFIDQQDKQFVPYVTAVQVGTSILFPNKDNIRHHVYSLSPAKKFELPLYSGVPAAPVLFDRPGFVTLGCNIHDWMIAYVAVLPTPYFAVTNGEGHATLRALPAGHYAIQAWHPLLKGKPEALAQSLDLAQENRNLVFALDLRPDFRARREPGISSGGYP